MYYINNTYNCASLFRKTNKTARVVWLHLADEHVTCIWLTTQCDNYQSRVLTENKSIYLTLFNNTLRLAISFAGELLIKWWFHISVSYEHIIMLWLQQNFKEH